MLEKDYPLLVADVLDTRGDIFTVECLQDLVEQHRAKSAESPYFAFHEFTGNAGDVQAEIIALSYDEATKTLWARVKFLETPKAQLVLEYEALRQKIIQENDALHAAHTKAKADWEAAPEKERGKPPADQHYEIVPKAYELAAGGRVSTEFCSFGENGKRTVRKFELGACALVTNKVK